MKLMIDIPDDLYGFIKSHGLPMFGARSNGKSVANKLVSAICRGVEVKETSIVVPKLSTPICRYSNFDSEGCWCVKKNKFVSCVGGESYKCSDYVEG